MKKQCIFFLFSLLCVSCFGQEGVYLDFETAWQKILSYSPAIAAADEEICIQQAERVQVSLLPNPVAVIERDNIGISHPDVNDDPPQTTYSLSQTVELGGKRGARCALATSLATLAYWDAQIARLEMRLQLAQAFIEVKAAQERLELTRQRVHNAERILETVKLQVTGGKVSPVQEKKAQLTLMEANLGLREACSELEQAKKALSSLWGCPCPEFDGVKFDLFFCSELPCSCCAAEGLYYTPDFIRAELLIASAEKNLRLQKANRIPDVTVTLGYRVFSDSGQNAWVAGVAFPLPLFNTNQGNIQRAACEIDRAAYQREEMVREFKEKIFIAYEKLSSAYDEACMIQSGILKEAKETFYLTESGYQNGKFPYIDLLEAEQLLFEVQERYIESLYNYHLNKAVLSRVSTLFCEEGYLLAERYAHSSGYLGIAKKYTQRICEKCHAVR